MSNNQVNRFLNGEGDAYYARNAKAPSLYEESIDIEFICKTLSNFRSDISNILEIGCADGRKLATLSEYFDADGFGIDPSKLAIDSAVNLAKGTAASLDYAIGSATNLPYEDEQFDLVFIGFCLYLIPPRDIYRAIQEADRVLRGGRFIAILDFDYGHLNVNPYSHAPGIFSYKSNYSHLFTALGYYHQISKWNFSIRGDSFSTDRNERVAIEILYKELF